MPAPDFAAQFQPEGPDEDTLTELARIIVSKPFTPYQDTWTGHIVLAMWGAMTGNPDHVLTVSEHDGFRLFTTAALASGRFGPLPKGTTMKAKPGHIIVPHDYPAFRLERAKSPPQRIEERTS